MSLSELAVLLAQKPVGTVARDRRGKFYFAYDESFRTHAAAIPLSLSMPLALSEHGHDAIAAFMWGLLPDNERTLDRWAKRFHVSAGNPFALLAHVGEDCAGAVQFAPPERVEALTKPGPPQVEWLTESDVAERLRALREDQDLWRMARDSGQFSLAGAQPKTALLFSHSRWGVPSGRTPTTHILKPPTGNLDGHAENEHICLALARAVGFPTPNSDVHSFETEKAIVVERYDRLPTSQAELFRRVHQEDLCQALGILPTSKYQNENGPTPQVIVGLLREHSSQAQQDIALFVDALAFNWLIGGTDAHAKNYSVLLGERRQVQLAPLYDLGSALPYPHMDQRRLKMAMKIGDSYRIREITAKQFAQLAESIDIETNGLLKRTRALAEQVREQIVIECDRAQAAGLTHPIVQVMAKQIRLHAEKCLKALASTPGKKRN